jgi:hypothetical protein
VGGPVKTNKWAGSARTALGLLAVSAALLTVPLATALEGVAGGQGNPPAGNPLVQNVADSGQSTINTVVNMEQSAAPSAQQSPVPGAPVPNVDTGLVPQGETDSGTNVQTHGTQPTTSAAKSPAASSSSKASGSSLMKCATCLPNVRAPASGGGSVVGNAGAEDLNAEEADPGQPHVKDLTKDEGANGASPPSAVPGFGALGFVFALAGVALVLWVGRRSGS